jgi:hypothetical protein
VIGPAAVAVALAPCCVLSGNERQLLEDRLDRLAGTTPS